MNNQQNSEIFNKFGVEPENIRDVYNEMVTALRHNPKTFINHKKLLSKIFISYDEKIIVDNKDIYFALDDAPLTNFGAIVLSVKHTQEIDSALYDVELLVLSQHDAPKIICVNSLALRSSRWIEILGVQYRYKMITAIWTAIKIMTEFAPKIKVYNYSGWTIDQPNTYILNGKEICCKTMEGENDCEC